MARNFQKKRIQPPIAIMVLFCTASLFFSTMVHSQSSANYADIIAVVSTGSTIAGEAINQSNDLYAEGACNCVSESYFEEPGLTTYLAGTSITITRSAATICSGQSVNITWTYSLGDAPQGYAQYSTNGSTWINLGASPATLSFTPGVGITTFYGRVVGNLGIVQLNATPVSVTVYSRSSTTPTLISPANSVLVFSTPQTLSWSGTMGSHPSCRYEVQLNGGTWTSTGSATSYSANLTQGANTWRVRYYDGCNNAYYTTSTRTIYYYVGTACGTVNHNGDNWTIATNQTLGGNHINVGAFVVNSGVVVTVNPSCYFFNVEASSINVAGTINGNAAGPLGGSGGLGGASAYNSDTEYCWGGYGGSGGSAGSGSGGGTAGGNGTQGTCIDMYCGGLFCLGNEYGYDGGGGGGAGGGAGSYGGAGGYGAYGASGTGGGGASGGMYGLPGSAGTTYGTSTGTDISYGSGGAGGGGGGGSWNYGSTGGNGGRGGGQVKLVSSGTTTISGNIYCDGGSGGNGGNGGGESDNGNNDCSVIGYNGCDICPQESYDYAGGAGGGGAGGSGGGILVQSCGAVSITGTLRANGGIGGAAGVPGPVNGNCFDWAQGGAGGGGGRVKVFRNPCESNTISGTFNANGGSGGTSPSGSLYYGYAGSGGTAETAINHPDYVALTSGSIGGAHTVCTGANPNGLTNSVSAVGGNCAGTKNYQWMRCTSGCGSPPSNYAAISGATALTYDDAGPLTQTTYYVRRVTSGTCTQYSNIVAVTVVPDPAAPTATKAPADAVVCEGELLSLTAITDNGGGTGSCNIQYSYSVDGGLSFSAWSTSLPSFNAVGGTQNMVKMRKNCSGLGCDISPETTYTWNVDLTSVAGSISADPSTTVCAGSKATLSLQGYTGAIQWQTNASGSWQNISGATSSEYITPELTSSTSYRVIVTSGVCSAATSASINVNIVSPETTNLAANDYVWTGAASSEWNGSTNTNWLQYSGSVFSVPASVPGDNSNVFIRKSGSCFSTPPSVNVTNAARCNNLTIDSGNTLNLSSTGNLNVSGSVTNNGTLTVTGSPTIYVSKNWYNNGVFNPASGTVRFGTMLGGSCIIDAGGVGDGKKFNNITISGSNCSFGSHVEMNDLYISGGYLSVVGYDIYVNGSFLDATFDGAFYQNNSTAYFNGTTKLITGFDVKFNNLVINGSYSSSGIKITTLQPTGTGGNFTIAEGASFNAPHMDVAGNWTNQGAFTCGSGAIITFNGTNQQTINHNGASFQHVVFNNTSTGNQNILVTSPLYIQGNTTFTNGVVVTSGSGIVGFGSSAADVAGGTANSYIDGLVSKTGTTAFTFPTGEGDVWAPIGIAAAAASSTITAEYNFVPGPLNWTAAYMCNESEMHHTSGVEHWNLTTSNATPAVTLFWHDGSRSGITDLSDLAVAHWSGSCWQYHGGAVSGNLSSGSITSTIAFSSYSPITFGSKANINPLPVELVHFNATCSGNSVQLTWQTASEHNNDYFMLQRSRDMQKWIDVERVEGAGYSNSLREYVTRDAIAGMMYYRLVQHDYDGRLNYSNVIVVHCDDTGDAPNVTIFPNPFTNKVTVSIENCISSYLKIELFDMLGKKLNEWSFGESMSVFEAQLNIDNLPPSVYILKISGSCGVMVFKLEKN